jgi:hypothetical protein
MRNRLSSLVVVCLASCSQEPALTPAGTPASSRTDALGTPVDALVDLTLGSDPPNAPTRRDFHAPSGVAVDLRAPHAVVVHDQNNYRDLRWNRLADFLAQRPADSERVAYRPGSTLFFHPVDSRYIALSFGESCDGSCYYKSFEIFSPDGGATVTTSFADDPLSTSAAIDSAGRVFAGENGRVVRFPSLAAVSLMPDVALGQPDLTARRPNRTDARGLYTPTGVAVDVSVTPNRLYVADTSNHRVLVWLDANAGASGRPADLVIGQPDFIERPCGALSASSLCNPQVLTVDSTGRLYVHDARACRVLGFERPMANGPSASMVWGTATFTSSCVGSVGPSYLSSGVTGLAVAPTGDLFVSDRSANRVIRFPSQGAPPSWPATTATSVFGQASFTTTFWACPSATFCQVQGIATSGSRLFVTDYDRILEFAAQPDGGWPLSTLPTAATTVLGLPRAANAYSGTPMGLTTVDSSGTLWAAQPSSSRVLRFDPPFVDGELPASIVSEQGATGVAATTSATFISSSQLHRVVRFAAPTPPTGATPIAPVFGQTSFTSVTPNGLKPGSIATPTAIAIDTTTTPNSLWVLDSTNRRVLGWRTTDVVTGQLPDVILGAPDGFNLLPPQPATAQTLRTPGSVAVSGGLVYVGDPGHERIVAFRVDGGPAVAVFGQPDFSSSGCDGGSAEQTCSGIAQLAALPGGGVLVSNPGNHRILALGYDGGTALRATGLAGQDRLDLGGVNRVKAEGLNYTNDFGSVAIDRSVSPNRLYVTDRDNNRVLVWNDVRSLYNRKPADAVLGQPTLQDHRPGTGPDRLSAPNGVAVDATGRVAIADTNNHRVLVFNAPFAPGGDTVPDAVIGQSTFTANQPNRDGGPGADTLFSPGRVGFMPNGALLVADNSNWRLTWYDPPFVTGEAASAVFGQPSPTVATNAGCNGATVTPSTLCGSTGAMGVAFPDGGVSLFVGDGFGRRLLRFDGPLPFDRVADDVRVGVTGFTGFVFDQFGAMFTGDFNLNKCLPPYQSCAFFTNPPGGGGALAIDEDGALYVLAISGSKLSVYLGDGAPQALDAGVSPSPARTNETLVARYRFVDIDNDQEVGSSYRWFKGGVEQPGVTGLMVAPALTTRGEVWEFEVTPRDTRRSGNPARSAPVTILNTAPVARDAGLLPATAFTDDVLTVAWTATDDDGDPPAAPRVRWELDSPSGFTSQAAFNDLLMLPASATTKNQRWRVRLSPFDGTDYGAEVLTEALEVLNSPPRANAGPDQALRPTSALTAITASAAASTDADGDNLSFTWREGGVVLGTGVTLMAALTEGLHTLELEAYDGTARATDELLIDISTSAPDAGLLTMSGDVAPGWVALRGVASDALNRPLRYQWSQDGGPPARLEDATQATARYFAVERGARTFQFQAVAGATPAPLLDVTLTTTNLGPFAGYTPRLVLAPGAPVVIQARGVDDSNGDPLTHTWAATSIAGNVRDTGTTELSVTPALPGVYTLSHEATDPLGVRSTFESEVVVVGDGPMVAVRVAKEVHGQPNQPIALDASRTFTLDGRPISFVWQVVSGEGRLTGSRSAQAFFTTMTGGVVRVTASTAQGGTDSKDVVVGVGLPVAAAVKVPPARVADVVQLDASGSFDPTGVRLVYRWAQVSGAPVVLVNETTSRPAFTALRPGLLRFSVVAVRESSPTSASTPVFVDVVVTSGTNRAPTANAGADVQASPGTEVTLSSTGSVDPDGDMLRPIWEQVSGPPVAIDAFAASVRFTPRVPGRYRFELKVWDGEVPSEAKTVEVVVQRATNQAPVAVVTGPGTGEVNAPIALSGATSSDPDGDALIYRWTLTGFPTGATPTLDADSLPMVALTGTVPGRYTVRLQVSDGSVESPAVEHVVMVGMLKPAGCGCDSSGGAGLLVGLVAWALARRRR